VTADLLAHAYFVVLLLLPLQAVKGMRALNAQVLVNRNARLEFYRMAINGQWLLMPLTAAAAWGHGPLPQSLGLRLPVMSLEDVAVSIVVALLTLSQSPVVGSVRRRLAASRNTARMLHSMRNLLPRSEAEKKRWVGLSVTAGICEEIIFRGFLFLYLGDVLGMSLYGTVVTSSLIFALSHYYQGPSNVIRVGFIGLLFATTYALTGSLLIPIALHVVLDLGALYMADFVASDDAPAQQPTESPPDPQP
jgi:membrane protease YdiL (CAAX protease family)